MGFELKTLELNKFSQKGDVAIKQILGMLDICVNNVFSRCPYFGHSPSVQSVHGMPACFTGGRLELRSWTQQCPHHYSALGAPSTLQQAEAALLWGTVYRGEERHC